MSDNRSNGAWAEGAFQREALVSRIVAIIDAAASEHGEGSDAWAILTDLAAQVRDAANGTDDAC